MNFFLARSYSRTAQFLLSITWILSIAVICFLFRSVVGYKVTALLLLMSVSIVAMLFDMIPVLVSAVLSALIWNFFFIPPIYTFHIDNAEDLLMFFLYFFIALVNAVLTLKIRKEEQKARDQEEKEKTIRLYNTLFNSLSHELKTPIATIIGAVDTLQENQHQISIEQHDELLHQLNIAGARLERQVENLLNMSRLETGTLKPKLAWCDTNELIYAVIHKLAEGTRQTIFFEPNDQLPLLKFDIGLIEQVIYNLLHNAITYTPDYSMITINVSLEKQHCKIVVADNGGGISSSEIEHLFDKFYRIPQSKAGGSGLGLSIVKGFVEAHHGRVRAENNKQGGLSIFVEFPVEASYVNNLKHE